MKNIAILATAASLLSFGIWVCSPTKASLELESYEKALAAEREICEGLYGYRQDGVYNEAAATVADLEVATCNVEAVSKAGVIARSGR